MSQEVYRIIFAQINERKGSKIATGHHDEIYKDAEIDLSDIEHHFNPRAGDRVKLSVTNSDPPKVIRIESFDPILPLTGKITYLADTYGIVNGDYVFFIDNGQSNDWNLGDEVDCEIIEGEYEDDEGKPYDVRCESIKKHGEEPMLLSNLVDSDKVENEDPIGDNSTIVTDCDTECDNGFGETTSQFNERLEPAIKKPEIYRMPFGLPRGLYVALQSKIPRKVMNKVNSLIPRELNYGTYVNWHHAFIHLEECEMKASYELYKSREVWIERANNLHSIVCSKIPELRPPITIGDKIEVKKHTEVQSGYIGVVVKIEHKKFILNFSTDFRETYEQDKLYRAEFFYNRTIFKRKHTSVEYAKMLFDAEFLFPRKMKLADSIQLNATVSDGKLNVDGREVRWFKTFLNTEQKGAIATALRAECRPYPFIIFGPPGTGKTSTLIEVILQIYEHVPNCRIVIATQSNHAANVLAIRLIDGNPAISNKLLRLVSNIALEQSKLPKELHKYSASVLHKNAEVYENDGNEAKDANNSDVKKNCDMEYLKDFKIIIGTCLGLGVMYGSEFSDGYFTHAVIDEAAQCSECESMIPISFINPKVGQIIMAGDPKQLPPIVLSNHAKNSGMAASMLERYLDMYKMMEGTRVLDAAGYDRRLVAKLRQNYRALPNILKFYNTQFYDSQLVATISSQSSVEATRLRELSKIFPKRTTNDAEPFGIRFVDVDGENVRLDNRKSWENKAEIFAVKTFVEKLLANGVRYDEIGVITPYYAQVMALRSKLRIHNIHVGTVEEFQGEEKMVIAFSAVKTSGMNKALKFIFCPKRLNTATSRARMLVIIFGKAELLSGDENWNSLIEYCKKNEAFYSGSDVTKRWSPTSK